MKYSIMILLSLSNLIWAQTRMSCERGKFTFILEINKEDNIHLNILKGKNKVSSCNLKITSYDDGKKSESLSELYRFNKKECNIIYDHIASEIEVISSGYIKSTVNSHTASAYIIKNQDPLLCKILKN